MAEGEECRKEDDKVRVDFHVHTEYSNDSFLTLRKLLKTVERKGLDAIAITDHDSMEAFAELEQNEYYGCKVKVIKGCEFKTKIGDIIGIFISKKLDYNSPRDLIRKIHKAGGVAIVPHPFKNDCRNEGFIKDNVKVIEVLNGRTGKRGNQLAEKFAEKNHLIGIYSSDAHTSYELGRTYVEFDCKSLAEVKKRLLRREFRTVGKEVNPIILSFLRVAGAYKRLGFIGVIRRLLG